MTARTVPTRDRDLAAVAELVGDPTRIAVLGELAGGRALPAGELARAAGVHPATVTAHLRRLVEGGLVVVRAQGRHRYHELAGPQVAAAVEALARLAPAAPVRSLRGQRETDALSEARTCYDHLAGRRGVQLRSRLLDGGAVRLLDDRDHVLTDRGTDLVEAVGLDPVGLCATRRVLARSCLDVTQRRPHLAGALPAALFARFLALGWLVRGPGRVVRPSPEFDARLDAWLAEIRG